MARSRSQPDSPTTQRPARSSAASTGYETLATRPLYILAFLMPLLLAYEIGSIVVVQQVGAKEAIGLEAQRLIAMIFESFGVVGIHLPAFALVATLLVWHLISLDPWRIRLGVLAGMLVESAAWTIPMLLLAMALGPALAAAEPASGNPLVELSPLGRLTISIGAGLYEEMLFRLILIALLHTIAVDVLGISEFWGRAVAVVGAALAFAWFHDVAAMPSSSRLGARIYLFLAGVYLGVIFVLRGLGIVVGVHALYDTVVLLALESPDAGGT